MDYTLDLLERFQIPIKIKVDSLNLNIPIDSLPKQYIDNSLRVSNKLRCTIRYTSVLNRGGYGKILLANRTDLSGVSQEICVKAPHITRYSVCPESVIQWISSNVLEKAGISGAVPLVYDIFQYAGETRFSMSYIKGISCVECITKSSSLERAFLDVLVQLCFILGCLEQQIHLDHRDLKADNIWIREEAIAYSIVLDGRRWSYKSPFQVVILDFGFSCLGDDTGNAIVSLSDGILPRIDPCPKEGRDIFQFLSSLWSLSQIRSKTSAAFVKDIETLLSYKNKPYVNLMRKTSDVSWVYLLVSDVEFRHPPLHPLSLLKLLSIKYPDLSIQCE
jgi:serine/threonine protein kinase